MTEDIKDVVRAKRFELVGDNGETRALLDTGSAEHVSLSLFGSDGKERANLGVMPDGLALLVLNYEDGQEAIKATTQTAGVEGGLAASNSVVVIKDRNGQVRAQVGVNDEGDPSVSLADSNGNVSIRLEVDEEGNSHITISGRDGIGNVSLQARPDRKGIVIGDEADVGRAGLMLVQDTASLTLTDAEGRPRAILQLSGDGGQFFAFLDEEGNPLQ